MNILRLFLSAGLFALMGCSPVKSIINNQYQLSAYSTKQLARHPKALTLHVTAPDAVAEYQTSQMLYIKKPFQIEAFAKNAWITPPADMLYPLLVQSMQGTGYFHAVTSGTNASEADYRLDTQLLALEQNFLKKPSVIEFSVKVILSRTTDNQVIASRIINQQIPCPMDTPYGGVIAANKAALLFTAAVAKFVISQIKSD